MPGALPDTITRFLVDGSATRREAAAPRPPGEGEVLVEVLGSALGAAPGAEVSGRVVAAGAAAADWLGKDVLVPRLLPCGECDACRRGRVARCALAAARGPVATHETVPARFLVALEPPLRPEGVAPWQLAALVDAVAAPYAALARAQVAPGEPCAIVGGGVRGRFAAQVARSRGAHAIVVEESGALRSLAEREGAHVALDPSGIEARALHARLVEIAVAHELRAAEIKVLETTGTGAGRALALGLAAMGSTVALLDGGDVGDAALPAESLAAREGIVIGASAAHPDLLVELLALVVRGELRLDGEVVAAPMSRLASALEDARAGREARLVVLVPEPST